MKRIALVGASGGIGHALLDAFCERPDVETVYATRFRGTPGDAAGTGTGSGSTEVHWQMLDATDEAAVAEWMTALGDIDCLIHCCGFLHGDGSGPEKTIRHVEPAHFERSMAVNCLSAMLLGKYAEAALRNAEAGVFAAISARVGSITDNRLGGWYSYRASKAALNMTLKGLSIEWSRTAKRIRVLALHPGTTDTALSTPFQQNVPEGKLFPPAKTADYLLARIDEAHQHDSGRFVAYDGEEIPW